MLKLFFDIENNYAYLFFYSIVILSFCSLAACVTQQGKVESNYYCDLTKLTICDKKSYTSCTEISNTDFTKPMHTIFYPETLTAHSYEGSKFIQKVDVSFVQTLDATVLLSGHGINTEGDATVWSGSINRKNGDLVVTALSIDYSFIVNGECQLK